MMRDGTKSTPVLGLRFITGPDYAKGNKIMGSRGIMKYTKVLCNCMKSNKFRGGCHVICHNLNKWLEYCDCITVSKLSKYLVDRLKILRIFTLYDPISLSV